LVTLLFLFPESKVFLKQLDDALGVTEIVFLELVDLVEGFLQGVVSELAGLFVVLHNFIVENREVQGQAKLDGVAWGKWDLVGLFVSVESLLLDIFEKISLCVLGDVAVVVADHLDEEGPGLTLTLLLENLGVDHVDDALAISNKLGLDAVLVVGEGVSILGVLGVLLNRGYCAASSAFGADQILECN